MFGICSGLVKRVLGPRKVGNNLDGQYLLILIEPYGHWSSLISVISKGRR